MRILAGDIGGTKTRIGVVEHERRDGGGDAFHLRGETTYPSREHASLAEILRQFLDHDPLAGDAADFEAACFGIAGPVRDGRCQTTNLPWVVDAAELAASFDWQAVHLLNDLEALGWAIEALPPGAFVEIAAGQPEKDANAALIAAGTGLGEAGLARDAPGPDGRRRLRPFATEGGHTSFAPGNELEVELLRHLWRQPFAHANGGTHASWERVVSGPGLVTLYGFLVEHRQAAVPAWLAEEMREGDAAAAISAAAIAGRCDLCREALDLFIRLYGAEAGNLALKVLAGSGVYIGGSIALKLRDRLVQPDFREAFCAKGRMRPLLEAMPIRLLLDDRAPLLGAARFATQAGR